ncbi:MAG TPA: MATE family efflux transporter [Alcaligenes sp.]|nr:MATE family efflux transporter [Alcaligenes sp.]HRL26848.1 MATE family efflux transporter [Alcaligenes sp.]
MNSPRHLASQGHAWLAELQSSLRLGAPLILTNLAQVALLTTNLIFMGRLGSDALAAGSLSASLYHAFMIFSMGLVSAVIPMLATTLGRRLRDVREVQQIIRHGFLTALLITIPAWIVLWHAQDILILMKQDPAVAARSVTYMHTLQWSLLPYLGYIVLRSFLAAMEKPAWTLAIAVAAIGINALLGWMLVFGNLGMPAMGLAGAGLATTLSSLFMFIGLSVVVLRDPRFRRYYLFDRAWHWELPRLWKMWKLGIPIAITFTLETLVFYAAIMMMGVIGQSELAAHAIAMQICSVSYMIPLGFSQVATIRVGLSAGRLDPLAARRAGWIAYALGVGFMGLAALVFWFAPLSLISLFLELNEPDNQAVISLAISFLALAALFQLSDGAQAVAAGMLRGLHDTRTPMLLALIGYWVLGVPTGAVLAFQADMGGIGIWIGLVTGLSIVAVLLTLRWVRASRRLARKRPSRA